MLTADLRDEGFPARYSHVELALYQIFHEAGIERPFRPKHYKKSEAAFLGAALA